MLEGGGATGLLNKGGGEQQASWFSKQQAVEFPQVLTSDIIMLLARPVCANCIQSYTLLNRHIPWVEGAIPPLLPSMKPF